MWASRSPLESLGKILEEGGKEEEEKKGNCKRGGGKLKNEMEMSRGLFSACHFLKPLKFVWGVPKCQKWNLYQEKGIPHLLWGKFSNLTHFVCTAGYATAQKYEWNCIFNCKYCIDYFFLILLIPTDPPYYKYSCVKCAEGYEQPASDSLDKCRPLKDPDKQTSESKSTAEI